MPDATEADLIDRFSEQLTRALRWGEVDAQIEASGDGPDAVVDVPTPAGPVRLLVEVKRALTPESSRAAAEQVRRYAETAGTDGVVVVAPWLSRATREALTAAGVSWADVTGNMRLQVADPPLLVLTQGADRNPQPKTRGTRGLGGHRAVEVVRALTELEPPFTLSDLVGAIGAIDVTFVSRILRGLAEEGLIERKPRGPVTRVDMVGVVERWSLFAHDKQAPQFVKDAIRHYAIRYNGPSGCTESDDMENWNYAHAASRGTIARQHPYNYEMGLGRATEAFEDHGLKLPGRISDVTVATASENNQRGFYTRWQQLMEAKSWADLAR